jgi:hypothetical protein
VRGYEEVFVRFGLLGWVLIPEFKRDLVSWIEWVLALWYKTTFPPFTVQGTEEVREAGCRL